MDAGRSAALTPATYAPNTTTGRHNIHNAHIYLQLKIHFHTDTNSTFSHMASSEMSFTPNSGVLGAGQLKVELETKQFHDSHDSLVTTTSTGIYTALNPLSMSVYNVTPHAVPVKRVADALTSLPAEDVGEHKQFLESHLRVLYQALDHSELFGTMNFHWNYQNPQLLDHLIREFNLEGIKSEMKTYKEDLQQFRKETPLKQFCQSQKKKHIRPPPDFYEVVAEFHFDWPNHVTLEVVEEFRQQYADHYSLRECAMMLAVVRPDCSFIITWFMPSGIVEKLKVEVPTSILKEYSVTKLEIAGECVYAEANEVKTSVINVENITYYSDV